MYTPAKNVYYTAQNQIRTHFISNVFSIVALNVAVQELGNITLWCFAKDTKDVTWFHNNTRILQYKMNGLPIIDKGFQNRVLLKEGAFKDGNLSLILLDARREDAGLYRCLVNDETAEGYPYVQMLHVNGKTGKVDLICVWSYKSSLHKKMYVTQIILLQKV